MAFLTAFEAQAWLASSVILELPAVQDKPQLFSTFLMWFARKR